MLLSKSDSDAVRSFDSSLSENGRVLTIGDDYELLDPEGKRMFWNLVCGHSEKVVFRNACALNESRGLRCREMFIDIEDYPESGEYITILSNDRLERLMVRMIRLGKLMEIQNGCSSLKEMILQGSILGLGVEFTGAEGPPQLKDLRVFSVDRGLQCRGLASLKNVDSISIYGKGLGIAGIHRLGTTEVFEAYGVSVVKKLAFNPNPLEYDHATGTFGPDVKIRTIILGGSDLLLEEGAINCTESELRQIYLPQDVKACRGAIRNPPPELKIFLTDADGDVAEELGPEEFEEKICWSADEPLSCANDSCVCEENGEMDGDSCAQLSLYHDVPYDELLLKAKAEFERGDGTGSLKFIKRIVAEDRDNAEASILNGLYNLKHHYLFYSAGTDFRNSLPRMDELKQRYYFLKIVNCFEDILPSAFENASHETFGYREYLRLGEDLLELDLHMFSTEDNEFYTKTRDRILSCITPNPMSDVDFSYDKWRRIRRRDL